METFTSLEYKLKALSKDLRSLKKCKEDAKSNYKIAEEELNKAEGKYNLKKSEIASLKSGLTDLYQKKLDILVR